MRQLTAALYPSLDGVMEHPTRTGPYFDGALAQAQRELLFASGTLLLRRRTYNGFAQARPGATDDIDAQTTSRGVSLLAYRPAA